jgi:hypothetical protein
MVKEHKTIVGQRVKVFCSFKKVSGKCWNEIGDIGDNSRYWFRGIIIDRYPNPMNYEFDRTKPPIYHPEDILIDVRLDCGELSKGHFESHVQLI